jgi:hypothetical protein
MTKARFKDEEALANFLEERGYVRLQKPGEKNIYLRKSLEKEDVVDGNVDVRIWKSRTDPMIEYSFSLVRCGNSFSKRVVVTTFKKDQEGMVPKTLNYRDDGGNFLEKDC